MTEIQQKSQQKGEYQRLQEILADFLSQTPETPLTKAIKILCRWQLHDPLALINPAHEERLLLMQSNWIIGLLWVCQKQSREFRKLQFPFSHPQFEFREPFGAWLNAELELWNGCFDFADTLKVDAIAHPSITDAWIATMRERMISDWKNSYLNDRKRDRLEALNDEIRLLSAGENPFDADSPNQRERFNLINLALAIGTPQKSDSNELRKRRKRFRDFTWNPYIAARCEWAKRFSQEQFKATRLTETKLEVVLGGRQMRTLYPAPKKSFLKQSRKKVDR
jgi:hypothetical protein